MNNIPDDPRLKDIESDPRGNKIRTGIEKETGTKIKDFKTDKHYSFLNDIINIHEKYGWKQEKSFSIT